jgi:L-alanine-DL-glutamate epimerase-like enolase superfamily enzyme
MLINCAAAAAAGVLDTSLTWVAGGITGSQAFAAWDRGFDVWLGTSRSNPPHAAAGGTG